MPAFAGAAAWQRNPTTATIDGEQVLADVMLVSGNYFEVLGAKARLGRPVQPGDDRAASAPVVVLSHAFWRSAFGGDTGVLGRRVHVSGLDYTVSGVMPARFSGHSAANVDMWVPFAAAMRQSPGWDQQPVPAGRFDRRAARRRCDSGRGGRAGERRDRARASC